MAKSRYKIPLNEWFLAQYTSLSYIKTANVATKRKLSQPQLNAFRRTIFGCYVDLNIIFSSVIHEALLREVVHTREDGITCNIRGLLLTFDKPEFLLMIVLWPSVDVVP